MHPISISLAALPLTNVRFPVGPLPHTIALFSSMHPLTIIYLPVAPLIQPLPVRFPLHKLSLIYVTVSEPLIASPLPLVTNPLALECAPVLVDYHAFAHSLVGLRVYFTPEYSVLVAFDSEVL